jgi:hypothetical protein
MSHRKDTASTRLTPTLRTSHGDQGKPAHPTSGRVAFDARGNAVWELRTADHGYVRDVSTTMVRKLQPPAHLAIEATTIVRKLSETPVPKGLDVPTQRRAVPADAGNSHAGNSHDRASMGTVRTYPVRSAAAARRSEAKKIVAAPNRSGLLGRLFSRKP